MKKTVFFVSIFLMAIITPQASAQSWLKKALDKVDNVADKLSEAVDKTLGNPTEQASKTTGYEAASVRSFSANVDFEIESCIFDGKLLIINFTLNNRGKDLQLGNFGGKKGYMTDIDTKFYDSAGNAYEMSYVQIGNEFKLNNTGGAYFSLPEGVKMRGSIGIARFDRKASALKSATIAGYILDERKAENNGKYTPVSISLKNVPVYTTAQILSRSEVLFTKEKPQIAQSALQCAIQSVVITEKNTQVNFSYTGSMVGYIYVAAFADTYITADGKRYALTAAYGIATHRHQQEFYAGGSQQNFTLVFENIPKPVETIDVIFDDWKWSKVQLLDPVGINIPKTSSAITV